MSNSIAVVLGIGLTLYILSLMGTIGIILGVVIIAWYIMFAFVWRKLDSHDKRFTQIVLKSIECNKSTTGEEFKIKPIKFKDELERARYNDTNYLQKDNDKIIIKRHYLRDEDYNVCRLVIENKSGIAMFTVTLIDADTLEAEYKETENLEKALTDEQEKMNNKLDSLIDSLSIDNSKKK